MKEEKDQELLDEITNDEYKYGFVSDIDVEEFTKKVWEQNLFGPSFKQIKEDYMKEYLSHYIYGVEDSHLEVITYDFNEGFKWNDIYGQDFNESKE